MYEVEIKYPVDDPARLEADLLRLGARFTTPVRQADRYYAHPCRDFARTDEALRLRSARGRVVITWKGPRIGGDTKTRREIELPLGGGDRPAETTLGEWDSLLAALGFRQVREVAKERSRATLEWQGGEVEVALDRLPGLGVYLELELTAEEAGVADAEARLRALATALGCGEPERRSYLEMTLAREQAG